MPSHHEAYRIPVHAFSVSNDDGGSGANIKRGQIRDWVRKANKVFQPAGIAFEFRGVMAGSLDPRVAGLDVDFAFLRNTTLNNLGHQRANLDDAADLIATQIASVFAEKLVVFFRSIPSWTGTEVASDTASIGEGDHVEVSFQLDGPGEITVTGGKQIVIVVRNTPPVITRDENLMGRIELFAPGQSQPVATSSNSRRWAPRLNHEVGQSNLGLGGIWRARFTHLDARLPQTSTIPPNQETIDARVEVKYPGGIVHPTQCACAGFTRENRNYVVMPGFWTMVCLGDAIAERRNIGLLAHEIGYYLGLDHTHKMEFPTVAAAEQHLASSGATPENSFDGDGLASTPLDPFIEEKACRTAADPFRVVLGERSYPLPRTNVMAYYDSDFETLTHEQVDKVRSTARERSEQGLRLTPSDSLPAVFDPSAPLLIERKVATPREWS